MDPTTSSTCESRFLHVSTIDVFFYPVIVVGTFENLLLLVLGSRDPASDMSENFMLDLDIPLYTQSWHCTCIESASTDTVIRRNYFSTT